MASVAEHKELIDEARYRLRAMLEGMTDEMINRRPAPEANPVVSIVRHVSGGARRILGEWIGGVPQNTDREWEFSHQPGTMQEMWELIALEERTSEQIFARLTDADLDRVTEVPHRGFKGRQEALMLHLFRHWCHHIGQMATYRRLFGLDVPKVRQYGKGSLLR